MKALEDDTDYKLRTVKESELNLMDMDETVLRQNLKDRQHGNDYINEVDDGRKRLEQYIKVRGLHCNTAYWGCRVWGMVGFMSFLENIECETYP